MTENGSIQVVGNAVVIAFPKRAEFNWELRRITGGNVQFDYGLRGYRMEADLLDHPRIRESLKAFARRHGLRFRGEACVRAGAFLTLKAVERIRAEIAAIEKRLWSTRPVGPTPDGGEDAEDYRDRLGSRRHDLYGMRSWARSKSRPRGCGLITPGSLVHLRYPSGEEGAVTVSAVEIYGSPHDRVSPFTDLGRFLEAASVGLEYRPTGRGGRPITIVAVED